MNWLNKLKMYQTLNRSGSSTPRLECRLSPRLVIVSTEDDPRSLKLKVSIETTNTAEVKSIKSPVDSDTTGNFIDWEYICSHCLTTCQLSKPVPVFNVDRTPNDASSIIEVVDLILWYQDHSERTLFTVTSIYKQHLILGHSWLQKNNPEFNWASGEVKISPYSARCCSDCWDELHEEHKAQKNEAYLIARCSSVPLLVMIEDDEDDPPALLKNDKDEEDPEFEEEDCMFVVGLHQCTLHSPIDSRWTPHIPHNSINSRWSPGGVHLFW